VTTWPWSRRPPRSGRLSIDPTKCDGVGICAHLAPRVVRVDRWGYPLISQEPLTGADLREATRAAAACPRRALAVERVPHGDGLRSRWT